MGWTVLFDDEFAEELLAFGSVVRVELLVRTKLLERFGPSLGRPWVDTLKGSRHANMKELRFHVAGGVWRVAFAFDPKRRAVLLAAGDKAKAGPRRFYKRLISMADRRLDLHLAHIDQGEKP